jgi:hypothetical protein
MSTTIRPLRWLGRATLVLAAWALIMLVMPFVGPPGRQLAVVGDSGRAVRAIAAAGGRIVEMRRGAILARSDDPHFPSRLYRNGARLVLEGRIAGGCFSRR